MTKIYDYKALTSKGKEMDLTQFNGTNKRYAPTTEPKDFEKDIEAIQA